MITIGITTKLRREGCLAADRPAAGGRIAGGFNLIRWGREMENDGILGYRLGCESSANQRARLWKKIKKSVAKGEGRCGWEGPAGARGCGGKRCLINFINKVMSGLRQARGGWSWGKTRSASREEGRYLVIDSENEEGLEGGSEGDESRDSIQPISVTHYKEKSCLSNFLSQQLQPSLDAQIQETQREVDVLEKECQLLEKLIDDMAEERASLLVHLRVRERRESLKRDSPQRCCHSNCKVSLEVRTENSHENYETKKKKEQPKGVVNVVTPLMTRNVNYSKMMTNMDDIKTVEMKPTRESL